MKQVTIEDAVNAGKALGVLEAELARFEMEHCQRHPEAGSSFMADETEKLRDAAKRVMQSFGSILTPPAPPMYSKTGEPPYAPEPKCECADWGMMGCLSDCPREVWRRQQGRRSSAALREPRASMETGDTV